MAIKKEKRVVPLNEKLNLTVEEAALYTGIGQKVIRKMLSEPGCPFFLKMGEHKFLVRREEFEKYLKSKNDFS